jgi:hypothetical protein
VKSLKLSTRQKNKRRMMRQWLHSKLKSKQLQLSLRHLKVNDE